MLCMALMMCFVRPSGTEDVVRVYAEADTQVVNAVFVYRNITCS